MQRSIRPSPAKTAAGVALLALSAVAVANDDLEARLRPFSEVPSVSSTASGRFKAEIDERANSISYQLSYSGLQGDVRQAHIHLGQKSVNGGIMVFLCQTSFNPDPTGLAPACPQSGTVHGVIQAANIIGGAAPQGIDPMEFAEVIAAIRGGVAYVNVHSSKFLGGEIRGQLRDD
ncbi:MAG TPA: CHRD domain-containing protein [Burkholderiaceae bacterium]|nr:CHRD domain-containing protein [Burkholderiaceae bacterium]